MLALTPCYTLSRDLMADVQSAASGDGVLSAGSSALEVHQGA